MKFTILANDYKPTYSLLTGQNGTYGVADRRHTGWRISSDKKTNKWSKLKMFDKSRRVSSKQYIPRKGPITKQPSTVKTGLQECSVFSNTRSSSLFEVLKFSTCDANFSIKMDPQRVFLPVHRIVMKYSNRILLHWYFVSSFMRLIKTIMLQTQCAVRGGGLCAQWGGGLLKKQGLILSTVLFCFIFGTKRPMLLGFT